MRGNTRKMQFWQIYCYGACIETGRKKQGELSRKSQSFHWFNDEGYEVTELSGDRAVLKHNGDLFDAFHVSDLEVM